MQCLAHIKVVDSTTKSWALYQVTKHGKSNQIIPASEALSLVGDVAAS